MGYFLDTLYCTCAWSPL